MKITRYIENCNGVLKERSSLTIVKDILFVVLIFIICLFIKLYVFSFVRVSGTSMEPNYHSNELVACERVSYYFSSPKRGDVIICNYPDEYFSTFQKTKAFRIKRVIGVAGDRIKAKDGIVYVNGEPLDESYLKHSVYTEDFEELIVPDKTVFVMGDNRMVSMDSRNKLVGPIPLSNVWGKVIFHK